MKHMVYHHWTTEQKTDSFDLSREKIRNQILKNWERGRERARRHFCRYTVTGLETQEGFSNLKKNPDGKSDTGEVGMWGNLGETLDRNEFHQQSDEQIMSERGKWSGTFSNIWPWKSRTHMWRHLVHAGSCSWCAVLGNYTFLLCLFLIVLEDVFKCGNFHYVNEWSY